MPYGLFAKVYTARKDRLSSITREPCRKVMGKPNGMGMGLCICRSIIEVHGGRLSASPGSPHGTVFQFTVPASVTGSAPHCE
jgi:K+-sensing histidine kinase KdpD